MIDQTNEHYCEICGSNCFSYSNFLSHINGNRHKRKIQSLIEVLPPPEMGKTTYICKCCDVATSDREAFESHLKNPIHLKSVKSVKKTNTTSPFIVGDMIPPLKLHAKTTTEEVYDGLNGIGNKFIKPLEVVDKQTLYRCDLCKIVCPDVAAKNQHIKGKRHKKNYEKRDRQY